MRLATPWLTEDRQGVKDGSQGGQKGHCEVGRGRTRLAGNVDQRQPALLHSKGHLHLRQPQST